MHFTIGVTVIFTIIFTFIYNYTYLNLVQCMNYSIFRYGTTII